MDRDGLAGHRQRLRDRFLKDPDTFSEEEFLELLLTYSIPRQDVAPIASLLLTNFGDLDALFEARYEALQEVKGVGEQTALFLKLIGQLRRDPSQDRIGPQVRAKADEPKQEKLFDVEPTLGPIFESREEEQEQPLETFVDDEAANALIMVPRAADFDSYEGYHAFLLKRMPYNSASTRKRRAQFVLQRYFANGEIDTPLTYYATHCQSQLDLKPAIFYQTLKAERLVAKVAEELVWPNLPNGRVERSQLEEFVAQALPGISKSSLNKVIPAIFNAYEILGVGMAEKRQVLRFQIHKGTPEGFLYVLTSEFPEAGMYSFDALEKGPMRKWLLWDREWIHKQLYNLRDFGVLSKVSQIDTVRQFSLPFPQIEALKHYFEHPEKDTRALREKPDDT